MRANSERIKFLRIEQSKKEKTDCFFSTYLQHILLLHLRTIRLDHFPPSFPSTSIFKRCQKKKNHSLIQRTSSHRYHDLPHDQFQKQLNFPQTFLNKVSFELEKRRTAKSKNKTKNHQTLLCVEIIAIHS